jgi:hypothetical protein
MFRLDRTRDNFGKHGREQEKVFVADQRDFDVLPPSEDPLEMPRGVDTAEATT